MLKTACRPYLVGGLSGLLILGSLSCAPGGTRSSPAQQLPVISQAQRADMLRRMNAFRAEPRRCGDRQMPAAAPLLLNDSLNQAAYRHSLDMYERDFFDHQGSDGSRIKDRLAGENYSARAAGENLAFNQRSGAEVLQDWLSSPTHCRNLMSASYSETGIAHVNWLWTQVFATPVSPVNTVE